MSDEWPEIARGKTLARICSLYAIKRGLFERDSILRRRALAIIRGTPLTRWMIFREWIGSKIVRLGESIKK